MKFYKCEDCQSVAMEIITGQCAGEKNYREVTANTVDASQEKHVPVVEREGNTLTVKVGSVEHPMLEEHYIMFIYLETCSGGILQRLKPGDEPKAVFEVPQGQEPKAVYEYCNLHGLWKTEL